MRKILYGITYMWNLKYGTNELTETDSQTENKLMVTKGERVVAKNKVSILFYEIQNSMYKRDKQQGLTVYHRELYIYIYISCNKP